MRELIVMCTFAFCIGFPILFYWLEAGVVVETMKKNGYFDRCYQEKSKNTHSQKLAGGVAIVFPDKTGRNLVIAGIVIVLTFLLAIGFAVFAYCQISQMN